MKKKQKIKLTVYQITLMGTWAVSILLLGAGYFMLYEPRTQLLVRTENKLSESNETLALAKMADREDSQRKQAERLENTQQTIDRFSISQENITALVFEIGEIANELRISEFSSKIRDYSQMQKAGNAGCLQESWLSIECTASFEQLMQFINRLEKHDPVVFVEKLSIQRRSGETAGHEIEIELSLLASEKKAAAPVANAQ